MHFIDFNGEEQEITSSKRGEITASDDNNSNVAIHLYAVEDEDWDVIDLTEDLDDGNDDEKVKNDIAVVDKDITATYLKQREANQKASSSSSSLSSSLVDPKVNYSSDYTKDSEKYKYNQKYIPTGDYNYSSEYDMEDNENEEDQYEETNFSTFTKYHTQPINIDWDIQQPHPDPLIESSSLAGTKCPEITEIPKLQFKPIVEKGKLSYIQLETVLMARDRHSDENRLINGSRRGFYLGDGAGVGKGAYHYTYIYIYICVCVCVYSSVFIWNQLW